MEKKNPIQVAERIFTAIEYLAGSGPISLQELSDGIQLNKSTVHRILNSLICMGYVNQDAETLKYYLSYKFCKISTQILSQNNIIDLFRPYLKELAESSGEIVHLVQIDGIQAVYIDKVEASKNSVRLISKVGQSIPLYCSGVGSAMLADMTDEKILSIWERSDRIKYTANTTTSFDSFMKKINQVRETGYAVDDEEKELGVRCVAVSIPDYKGSSKYAISISAPKSRMDDARIKELSKNLIATQKLILKEI